MQSSRICGTMIKAEGYEGNSILGVKGPRICSGPPFPQQDRSMSQVRGPSSSRKKAKMKEIPLTQGFVALIDDEDVELVSRHKWFASRHGSRVYARTNVLDANSHRKTLPMHRLIMNPGRGLDIDHINGNGIDNRRSNLRSCSRSRNKANAAAYANNRSGFKGVYWQKDVRKWRAQIRVMGRKLHLGLFDARQEAALAYNKAAVEHFGEFARLNEVAS